MPTGYPQPVHRYLKTWVLFGDSAAILVSKGRDAVPDISYSAPAELALGRAHLTLEGTQER